MDWLKLGLDCLGYPMTIYGVYGILAEGFTTYFHPEKRGTFDSIRMAIYSIFAGIGFALIWN